MQITSNQPTNVVRQAFHCKEENIYPLAPSLNIKSLLSEVRYEFDEFRMTKFKHGTWRRAEHQSAGNRTCMYARKSGVIWINQSTRIFATLFILKDKLLIQ